MRDGVEVLANQISIEFAESQPLKEKHAHSSRPGKSRPGTLMDRKESMRQTKSVTSSLETASEPGSSPGSAPPAPVSPEAAKAVADEVLARAQAGDHQAFAQLYAQNKRRVYSLCMRMVGNVAEAEDLTQEAFLQLHRKIGTFRGESSFSTWLHRMAINVVLMHLRRKGLQLTSLDEAMEPAPDQRPGRSFGAPDLTLTGAIDRLALQRAIDDLPAGYRLMFVLHDIEGYEHNEIATMLECSIGTSKSQLHKARLKLRDALRIESKREVANDRNHE
jgi:RNA polymerase sigma-70 factor, ECF subfamily